MTQKYQITKTIRILLCVVVASLFFNRTIDTKQPKKKWTFFVYMAAVNDLRSFAAMNIKQMTQIGSNEHINIVIHLDILLSGNKKITRRYYVEQGRVVHMNVDDPSTQQMDSGDPETVISSFKWMRELYPSDYIAWIGWNHGTGPLDPGIRQVINTTELFVFNPKTNTLELDRNISFIDYISATAQTYMNQRGICWDDITGNYLTNQKLEHAFKTICHDCLDGNKIDLVCFDACLMMGAEIADLFEPYADFLIGSQEVELGLGWRYDYVLEPFQRQSLMPREFAKHIVDSYKKAYRDMTNDYTQSAVELSKFNELKETIHCIASILCECLAQQKDQSVKKAIKASRSKKITTVFDEPTYIDLYHWFTNLQASVKYFNLVNPHKEKELKLELLYTLEEAKKILDDLIIANEVGKNLSKARGLSIYFPEKNIHPSYKKTPFWQSTEWSTFLTSYLDSNL